ncbi:hypothetical protein QBC38DRAFT_190743 [Podospora fimiseda]|uniref:RWD domain-containing protein n=1 Tax=Podospora fimiseda TaxID=252190 RepID=A0AAN7GZ29_9PEZI|nr:hypothetical protein QBC38DRAFT_190743 [Podospora fimiseda]
MPFTFNRLSDPPKKGKVIKSAFDSETFDLEGTIHVDGLVGSATISPSGRDVALASPEGLAIIDLDSPWSPPRRLSSHGLPWLVVDVQWSPFAIRDYWVASTANHRCLVWNLNKRDDSSSGAVEHSLQAHSRAITDINFSAHHPDSLATCAVDGYVHCWDLRRPRQPALTFCDWFAGATQVKYSRQDEHFLASAHDRWLHIWDRRRTSEPLKTISAHTSKIYGIDWNRTKPTCLVTCSLDKSIKFWDYSQDGDTPERVIRTNFPVWRARHTPFGSGLLAMPQNEPGDLYLYDRRPDPEAPIDGPAKPVAIFQGHGDHKVKEFLWRARGSANNNGIDEREFQLVSWGEDNELRLHKVEPQVFESVGYVRGSPSMQNLILTRKGAMYKTFRTVDDSIHRDRRSPTMSDPRPGSSGHIRSSALSLGLSTRVRRVGPSWRATSMKANTNRGKALDKSQLQIGWMKGITMSKRKSGSDMNGKMGPQDSGVFGPSYDDEWGEPETIQEEILRIGQNLPNVTLENIDWDALIVKASLKGPWGAKGGVIWIKVKVDIPTNYPKIKAPRFIVEKTSFMPDEIHKKIQHELHELADRFLHRKENCLFTAFEYLLGEVDLESSTTFLSNVRALDDDLDGLADESSSEDDEHDIPAGGSASMSQELSNSTEIDPTAALAPTQRPILPPPPRLCGATFSNDGRLVCFFPSKDELAKKALFLAPPDSKDRQKGEPNFAGFGRLHHSHSAPRHRINDDTSVTDDQTDDSDSSSTTSTTDSEPTTVDRIPNLWYQPGRHFRRALSTNDSLRSSGGGTGPGTGTGTGTSRRRLGRPKNILHLHDLRYLLPSKKEFAQEYAIFGDGADVCTHNAAVANKYGYTDLASIWKYAALLLKRGIPLEFPRYSRESILVIAKEAVARAGGFDGNYPVAGRVKWGCHPLARELIADLFEYFEKLADIQMLAMLTCIFGDSAADMLDGLAYAASRSTQLEIPLPMKAPTFSLDYFPTDPAIWNGIYISQPNSTITTPRIANTPAMYSNSPGSDDVISLIDLRGGSWSAGETPPNHVRQVQSLSTSPSNKLFSRTNSSSVAAAFTASLPRALANMVSGSPPDPPSRKRPSPAEILSNLTPSALTWGAATMFGSASETPGTATTRTSSSDDEVVAEDINSMVPVAVSCAADNQGMFDDDGWMSSPLIDIENRDLYSQYRYAYGEMLQMWGESLSRLEIMKFNHIKDERFQPKADFPGSEWYDIDTPVGHSRAGNTSPVFPLGGRKERQRILAASGRGLDINGMCHIHEIQLDPIEYTREDNGNVGGAVGICLRCYPENGPGSKVPQDQLTCVYCLEPVVAQFSPCFGCGCVSHEHCLADWHAMGETECPAGDECHCTLEASNGQIESWTALQHAMAMQEIEKEAAKAEAKAKAKPPPLERSHTSSGGLLTMSKNGNSGLAAPPPSFSQTSNVKSRRKSAPTELARFHALNGLASIEEQSHSQAAAGSSTRSKIASGIAGGILARVSGGSAAMFTSSSQNTPPPPPPPSLDIEEENDAGQSEDHGEDENGIDIREEWESIVNSRGIPSVTITGTGSSGSSSNASSVASNVVAGFFQGGMGIGGGKPPIEGDEPVSAARLSLGNRLKKSLAAGADGAARPASPLRRKSGGVTMWKSGN